MKLLGLTLFLACCVCVALSTSESLAKVAHYEPVKNFVVNDARDRLSFVAYGKVWEFEIWLSEVYIGNTDHFHGHLIDNLKSSASFSLLPHTTTGMIILNNDTLWLESHRSAEEDETTMRIYKSSDVHLHPSAVIHPCGTHAGHQITHDGVRELNQHKRYNHVTAIVYDQNWADSGRNPWADSDSTYALLNDVNNVYRNANLNQFTFQIYGRLHNKYDQNSQLQNMLMEFSHWAQDRLDTNRYTTAAYLVGSNVGGLAWVGTACRGTDPFHQTAVAGLVNFSRLWTVKTIAHELGHNRGAQHDFGNQCDRGQRNNCQCSVMSYCFPDASTFGGAVNYFSQNSIGEIQSTCN